MDLGEREGSDSSGNSWRGLPLSAAAAASVQGKLPVLACLRKQGVLFSAEWPPPEVDHRETGMDAWTAETRDHRVVDMDAWTAEETAPSPYSGTSRVQRRDETPPTHVGVGMGLRARPDGALEVTEIVPSGPVARTNQVTLGDILRGVDGTSVSETVSSARDLLLGPPGTQVQLTLARSEPNAVGTAVAFFGLDATLLQQTSYTVTVVRAVCPPLPPGSAPHTPHLPLQARPPAKAKVSGSGPDVAASAEDAAQASAAVDGVWAQRERDRELAACRADLAACKRELRELLINSQEDLANLDRALAEKDALQKEAEELRRVVEEERLDRGVQDKALKAERDALEKELRALEQQAGAERDLQARAISAAEAHSEHARQAEDGLKVTIGQLEAVTLALRDALAESSRLRRHLQVGADEQGRGY